MKSGIILNFLGGCGEIGGNKILLHDLKYRVKLFIDFGCCFENLNKKYKKYHFPGSFNDLFKSGAFPKEQKLGVKNLYSMHFIFNHKSEKFRQKNLEVKGKKDPPTDIDGVLISHAHQDHYFGIPFLNRNIPIYMGVVTKRIIQAKYDSSKVRMETYYRSLKFKTFRTGDVIDIKGLKIEPIHVDHSIPAAYGFIIYTSAGPIVYSGDFRFHGPLAYMTQDLINKARDWSKKNQSRIRALICEGTQINKASVESEKNMKRLLKTLIKTGCYDYFLVKYNLTDWDRFRTFVRTAEKYDWKFIISEKDAYFYHLLNKRAIYKTMKNPSIRRDENIIIIKEEPAKYSWQVIIRQLLDKIEHRTIEMNELKSFSRNFFVHLEYFDDSIIEKINPLFKGAFISCSTEKDNEQARGQEKTLIKKLTRHGLPFYRIHASGHAMPHDIRKMIDEINPELVFPMHTKYPEMFQKFLNISKNKVIIPTYSNPIQIDNNVLI